MSEAFKNFAQQLSDILKDTSLQKIIRKHPSDSAIQILDQKLLVEQVLPYYFKHSRLDSFFRQLTMYGFRKLRKMKNHTFFHPKLKEGFQVHDISSIKAIKKNKQKLSKKFINKSLLSEVRLQDQDVNQQIQIQQRICVGQEKNQHNFTNENITSHRQEIQHTMLPCLETINFWWNYPTGLYYCGWQGGFSGQQ